MKWQFEDYWQGQAKTVTYRYSGVAENFVIPSTVTTLKVHMRGGVGGGENIDTVAGGGYLIVDFDVTPGETLRLRVGGSGSRTIPSHTGANGAFNGGGDGGNGTSTSSGGYGGGGASDIRQGGDALANRIATAGGGGGNAGEGFSFRGGHGGGSPAGSGLSDAVPVGDTFTYPYGGSGATTSAGGAHGVGGGTNGALGVGGDGADFSGPAFNGAGGGGGGQYGGGGGGQSSGDGAGGGGGSNGANTSVVQVLTNTAGRYSVNPEDPYISLQYTEQADIYVWEINANDGGSPTVVKNIAMTQVVGPNRNNVLQEGQSQAPIIDFSGVILSQDQYETMEFWFDKRILIKLTDDLEREFYGVFSQWTPKRIRRQSHQWYHQYEAQFTLSAYKSASGNWVYGRID